METYNRTLLTQRLLDADFSLLNSQTLKAVLGIEDNRSYYRVVKNFIDSGILIRIEKDAYCVVGKKPDQFAICNFLYQPSYVSLESALNYWGILSQFPFEVTSATPKKTVSKVFSDTVYSYTHLASKYYGMFTKHNNILIALPEKAIFDQVYLASKGLRSLNFDEYDLTKVTKKSVLAVCQQLQADNRVIASVETLFRG